MKEIRKFSYQQDYGGDDVPENNLVDMKSGEGADYNAYCLYSDYAELEAKSVKLADLNISLYNLAMRHARILNDEILNHDYVAEVQKLLFDSYEQHTQGKSNGIRID